MAVVSFGAITSLEQPESPDILLAENKTVTRIWRGAFATLQAEQPAAGDTMAGYSDVVIRSSRLQHQEGDEGVLTVVSDDKIDSAVDEGDVVFTAADYDRSFTQVLKPLATHPKYLAVVEANPTAMALVEDALNMVCRDSDDVTKRDGIIAAFSGIDALFLEMYEKRRKGQDSYPVYVPVVTETKDRAGGWASNGGNKRENPPALSGYASADANSKPYIYIRMPDQHSKTRGVRRRTRVWMGFHEVDADLYP